MVRTYNIGTECYALLTNTYDPECLLPVKIVILEKHIFNESVTYKVKVKEIYETDFKRLKSELLGFKVSSNLKSENKITLVKRDELNDMIGMGDLLKHLNTKTFFLEENYITLSKDGLYDLYNRFVKYIINYHYQRIFRLTSSSFLANQPIFENQKDMFKRRVERIGFGDMFQKYDLKLDI